MYIIAGGGIKGLVCAIELAQKGYSVSIIDKKQELGTPINRPGLIINKESIEWLMNYDFPPQLNLFSFSNNIDNWYGLRMEWFEKSLAIIASSFGVKIFLKSRITSFINDGKTGINISGAGKNNPSQMFGNIVNCLEYNNPLMPTPSPFKMQKWFGGIANGHDMPFEWQKNGWKDDLLMIPRRDGTIECWTPKEKLFIEPESGWLEITTSKLGIFPYCSIDHSIAKGIELANNIIQNKG